MIVAQIVPCTCMWPQTSDDTCTEDVIQELLEKADPLFVVQRVFDHERAAPSQPLHLAQDKKPMKLPVGTKVSLNEVEYLVEEPIGQGGFGSVFKVSRSDEAAIAWVVGCK